MGNIGQPRTTGPALAKAVRDLFATNGLTTSVLFGYQNLAEGNGNRVVFVLNGGTPRLGGLEIDGLGVAACTRVLEAHIWGVTDTADDFEKHDSAEEIGANVVAAIAEIEEGRANWTGIADETQTHIVRYGEQFVYTFTLDYQIDRVPYAGEFTGGMETAVDVQPVTED